MSLESSDQIMPFLPRPEHYPQLGFEDSPPILTLREHEMFRVDRDEQRTWYNLAGYTLEVNEYQVEPERKGSLRTVPLEEESDEEAPQPLRVEVSEFDQEDFAGEVSSIAGLTEGEQEILWWILEGNRVGDSGYMARCGTALGRKPVSVEKSWNKAKAKLVEHWAAN